MKKPLLQVALDTFSIQEALDSLEKIHQYIDVIEVGTILLASVGREAIKQIRQKYPNKIIVADGKIVDAGAIFSKMFFESGADFITCICAAEIETIQSCLKTAKQFGTDKEIQIELTSNYNWKQVKEWQDNKVTQVVFHRSRDSQNAGRGWETKDLEVIKKLTQEGFRVTVTGGLVPEEIKLFANLEVFIFVGGRALRDSENTTEIARLFKEEIDKYWG